MSRDGEVAIAMKTATIPSKYQQWQRKHHDFVTMTCDNSNRTSLPTSPISFYTHLTAFTNL